ncbi:MAG: NADH-quinone oxidoreductase subunit A [Bacteroidetes bacterium]|nr:NADH-quinone oxidoreductase subunit A [Bacteroidota bacterium]
MERTFIPSDYIPIVIQSVVALGFVVITMVLTHIIGGKRKKIRTLRKDENFECGIEVRGNARFPFSVKYFLIAILFVLFDVEIIFFYPWAINFKEFGWDGFLEMLLFLFFLLFGFYYIYKRGALNWED